MIGNKRFKRPLATRRYKKLFVISTEGTVSEPQYFDIFNNSQSVIRVNCLKGNDKSSPQSILKRMKRHIRDEGLNESDEAWLVVDKDQWNDTQLTELHSWSKQNKNYGFAVSTPKFEYWLLLHFEDGTKMKSSTDCTDRLKHYLPKYTKHIDATKINISKINSAIERAKRLDTPKCENYPKTWGSTIYRLVENILANIP